MARLALIYDGTTDAYSNFPGVELRPVNFGGLGGINVLDPGVSETDQFNKISSTLSQRLGYQEGRNLHGAPYDWRLAGDAHSVRKNGVGGFYTQLQQLIEQTVAANGQKAVLLSHSLGGPTLLYFFHNFVTEEWRQQHIHGWVALSAPWLGSVGQLLAYMAGWTFGLPSWLVPHDYVKQVQVNATSGVWLAPNPVAFGNETLVTTPSRTYTAADVKSLIATIGEQAGGEQVLAMMDKKSLDLTAIQKPPSFVPLQNWYSNGVGTPLNLIFSSDITHGFDSAPREIVNGDGDGTVNTESLRQAEFNWPQVDSAPVTTRIFPNQTHYGMLFDDRVIDAFVSYLQETSSSLVV